MTWPIALFPLLERGAAEPKECSLDEYGGVLVIEAGVDKFSSLITVGRDLSWISIKSSSSLE